MFPIATTGKWHQNAASVALRIQTLQSVRICQRHVLRLFEGLLIESTIDMILFHQDSGRYVF